MTRLVTRCRPRKVFERSKSQKPFILHSIRSASFADLFEGFSSVACNFKAFIINIFEKFIEFNF